MSHQAMKRHEETTLQTTHCMIPAFWKRQNYGDSKGTGIDVGGINKGSEMILKWYITLHVSKPTACAPRANHNINCGLWVMTCWCRFNSG